MRHDKKMVLAWQKCVDFNDAHKIGSTITVNHDNKIRDVVTESCAWAQANGESLVMIKGVCSPVPLHCVVVPQLVAS